MSNGSLYTNIQNNIATVEFFHPASNSFPSELLARLTKSINELSKNDEVYVIILKSEGDRAFCAGASFDELVAINNFTDGKQFFLGFANVINAMRRCKKPIIARVQGKVVGGGVGLVSACDYAYATDQAAIKLSELTIGIGPFVIAPVVKHKMGNTALRELTLNATKWHNAYWAKEKGLFADVFDSTKQLDESVEDLAIKLASYNPEAVQKMKSVFWKGTENWDKLLEEQAEISGELVLSEFTKNALEKFKK
jgi:methylglutaconyl-CoA hydratase